MRERWYSDKRDLVKWATLVHLAKRWGARQILHVAFFKAENLKFKLSDGQVEFALPPEVWKHFRDLNGIRRLGKVAGIPVEVIDKQWPGESREKYFENIVNRLGALQSPLILFLDPDTGIEPKKCRDAHIKTAELDRLFAALKPRGWLVMYQHARREESWQGRVNRQFADAVGTSKHAMRSFSCAELAKDVVFFAAEKT